MAMQDRRYACRMCRVPDGARSSRLPTPRLAETSDDGIRWTVTAGRTEAGNAMSSHSPAQLSSDGRPRPTRGHPELLCLTERLLPCRALRRTSCADQVLAVGPRDEPGSPLR